MSATQFTVAFVGTGPNPETPVWGESAAMAYRHAAGYRALSQCDLAACADLVAENAEAFATEFSIPEDGIYEEYEKMLAEVEPDIVSVCTPVPTHAPIVIDAIESGHVGAVHCEKPMANTWGDAKRMAAVADDYDVQLTFNHQRRFDPAWREAKRLLDGGEVGKFERIEVGPRNVLDHGTHLFDMCTFFTDARPIDWAIGQVDYRTENVRYGTHNVNQGVIQWAYEPALESEAESEPEDGGEGGSPLCGFAAVGEGSSLVGCSLRLRGSAGVIELEEGGDGNRIKRDGGDWETIKRDVDGDLILDAIEHVVESFAAGTEPELSVHNALVATELIYGTYESVHRRERVDFPLDIEGNPLETMVETGELTPVPAGNDD